MNLPFFPIIYNIIFDCFFIDISMASPGAVLSLPDKGQEGHKKHFPLKGKCFVRNGIKISLTKCFIWQERSVFERKECE